MTPVYKFLFRTMVLAILVCTLHFIAVAQPVNDDCGQATALPVSTTGLPVFSASATQSATASMPGCTGTATADVWFSFTALQSTQYIYLQHNGFGPTNSIIQVFSGTCGATTSLSCNTGLIFSQNFPNTTVMAQTGLVAGQTYLIRVYYNNTTTTAFSIGVANGAPNNECADAINLTVSPDANSVFTPGTTVGATASTPNNSCIFSSSNDVWYSFTATAATHAIDILQLNNPRIQVFTGTCGSLTAIPCNFFYQTISDTSRATVSGLTPGTTYRVKVFSSNFNANNRLQIAVQTPFVAPNDVCSSAAVLPVSGNSCAPQRISFRGAVPDDVSHPSCVWTGGQDQDIWYAITPANSRLKVKFSQADGLATWTKRMALYSGICNNLTPIVCAVSDSFSISGLTTGATYYLRVSKSGGNLRDSIGELCAFVPDAVPYDECSHAAVLQVDTTYPMRYHPFTTFNATYSSIISSIVEPSGTGNKNDIFLKFTAVSDTTYIGLAPATSNLDYTIFSGSCNSPVVVSSTSTVLIDNKFILLTTKGVDYFIRLSSATPGYIRVGVSSTIDAPNKFCTNAIPVAVGTNSEKAVPARVQFGTSGLSRPSCLVGYTHETWFSFQAPSDSLGIMMAAQSGALGWEILTGDCNALVSVKCGTVTAATTWTPSVINGLNTGTHYLLRILSNGFVTESRQPLLYLYNAKKAGNNYCTQAVTLAVQPSSGYQLTAGSTAGNYNEVNNCTTTGEAWYTFTATAAAHTLVLKGNLSPRLSLYTGQCGSLSLVSGTCLTASQSGREVRNLINLSPGTTYFIRVAGTGNFANSGAFEIAVTQNSVPGNDECSNPVLLPVQQLQDAKANQYFTTRGGTASAPGSIPASACAASSSGDVWFGFTGNGKNLSVETEVLNSNFLVYLYSGSCGGFTEVACGENAGILHIASQNGTNYRVRLVPRFSSTQIEFRIRVYETPALLSNPIVQSDCLGPNLVLNPGLDTLKNATCPTNFVTQPDPQLGPPRHDLLATAHWDMPTFATTDIFSTCGGVNTAINPIFNTCSGNQSPRSGTNYAGFFAHNVNQDYQEYLQGQFAQPLTPGKTYLFSFNISLADYSPLAIDRLGVYFSQNPVRVPVYGAIGLTPQYETPAGQFFTEKNGWTTISFLYTPTEAAAYFVIGNFRHFTETNTMGALENGGRNAKGAFSGCSSSDIKPTVYYFIDDVSLAEVTGTGCLLPIDDLTWQVAAQQGDVRINWQKPTEDNVVNYRIEHSVDGRHFSAIATRRATGQKQYDFLHKNLSSGKQYYRIAVESKDGKVERTGVKLVIVGVLSRPLVTPTLSQGTISVRGASAQSTVSIINSMGQVIISRKVNDTSMFDLQGYAKGTYYVVIQEQEGRRFTEKIMLY